jgi:DNA replication protein DnaD
MARAMFEYTKTVLEKVSFNTDLFKKELEKAVNRLLPYEIKELFYWLKEFTSNKPELYSCLALVENTKRSL